MNALATTLTNAPPPTLAECRMSGTLRTLLLEHGTRSEAIEELASDPLLRQELRALKPELELTIAGCGPQAVKAAMGPMIAVFGVSEATRTPTWWKVFLDQLADLPADAVEAAAQEYVGQPDAEFMPKPGPLRALALKHAAPAIQAVSRARAALALPAPVQRERVSPEVVDRVRADLARKLHRSPSKPAFTAPPTPTNEHGVSHVMAAKLAAEQLQRSDAA